MRPNVIVKTFNYEHPDNFEDEAIWAFYEEVDSFEDQYTEKEYVIRLLGNIEKSDDDHYVHVRVVGNDFDDIMQVYGFREFAD